MVEGDLVETKAALERVRESGKMPRTASPNTRLSIRGVTRYSLYAHPFLPLQHAESVIQFRHFPGHLRPLSRSTGLLKNLVFTECQRQGVRMTMHTVTPLTPNTPAPEVVHFHRTELSLIMSLYGRMVAAGEWRDYGISGLRDVAVFSIFRRTAEHALYRIEKRPKLASKQGLYAIIGMDGRILRRGHDLKAVLRVLERKLIRSVD